jgi:2-alkyl-3-oxoalkanoate reductase
MRALVTGANGFLGRRVIGSLLPRGIEVGAMVRPAAHLDSLEWPSSVEVFRADLRTSRELGRAFQGVDVLLHLAAVIAGGKDAKFAGTVVSTERLLDAMAATACRSWCCAAASRFTITAPSAASWTRIRRCTGRRMSTLATATQSPSGGKSE